MTHHDCDSHRGPDEHQGLADREAPGNGVPPKKVAFQVLHRQASRVVVQGVVPHHHQADDPLCHLCRVPQLGFRVRAHTMHSTLTGSPLKAPEG